MAITLDLLIQLGVGIIVLIGFWFTVFNTVSAQLAIRDTRIAQLEKELAEHKLHAAETFATRSGVTESLDRVFAAIDRLTGRVDELLRLERRKDDP